MAEKMVNIYKRTNEGGESVNRKKRRLGLTRSQRLKASARPGRKKMTSREWTEPAHLVEKINYDLKQLTWAIQKMWSSFYTDYAEKLVESMEKSW